MWTACVGLATQLLPLSMVGYDVSCSAMPTQGRGNQDLSALLMKGFQMYRVLLPALLLGTLVLPRRLEAAESEQLVRVARSTSANAPTWLINGFVWMCEREAVHQLLHVVLNGNAGKEGGTRWYRPSQTRYNWERFAKRQGDGADSVTREQFAGPSAWFDILDRDRDGKITRRDLDWSEGTKLGAATQLAKSLFFAIDANRDGKVTVAEWQAYMNKLGAGRDELAIDDLIPIFMTDQVKPGAARTKDGQVHPALLKAFMDGDLGSWYEGPNLEQRAPDFTLRSPDGKLSVTLSDSFGSKPVVLIFGSFT